MFGIVFRRDDDHAGLRGGFGLLVIGIGVAHYNNGRWSMHGVVVEVREASVGRQVDEPFGVKAATVRGLALRWPVEIVVRELLEKGLGKAYDLDHKVPLLIQRLANNLRFPRDRGLGFSWMTAGISAPGTDGGDRIRFWNEEYTGLLAPVLVPILRNVCVKVLAHSGAIPLDRMAK